MTKESVDLFKELLDNYSQEFSDEDLDMTKNSILTDSEIEEGFVLTCQAYPITPEISIDFDDV